MKSWQINEFKSRHTKQWTRLLKSQHWNLCLALQPSFSSFKKRKTKLAKIATQIRARRLTMELTQEGLSKRSGVPLPTLRKFEQKGAISLESFLKLLMVLGGIEEMIEVLKPSKPNFTSIDEVLKNTDTISRKRGHKK